jgi:hypothetical protein
MEGGCGGSNGSCAWESVGGSEEGNLVASLAAAIRRYHPCEQRALARGPVLRQSGRVFDLAVL